jgi:hypothetical protein
MSPRRARQTTTGKRRRLNWAEAQEYRSAIRWPVEGSNRIPEVPGPITNALVTAEGCAELARMILDKYTDLPQAGRRQLALDILEGAIDFGFAPPRELLTIMKRELATKPTGVTTKPEYQRALAIKRENPSISVRALAAEVGVPWPTIARWQRTEYWKLIVSPK